MEKMKPLTTALPGLLWAACRVAHRSPPALEIESNLGGRTPFPITNNIMDICTCPAPHVHVYTGLGHPPFNISNVCRHCSRYWMPGEGSLALEAPFVLTFRLPLHPRAKLTGPPTLPEAAHHGAYIRMQPEGFNVKVALAPPVPVDEQCAAKEQAWQDHQKALTDGGPCASGAAS